MLVLHDLVKLPFLQGDYRVLFGLFECINGDGYRGRENVTWIGRGTSDGVKERGSLLRNGWNGR